METSFRRERRIISDHFHTPRTPYISSSSGRKEPWGWGAIKIICFSFLLLSSAYFPFSLPPSHLSIFNPLIFPLMSSKGFLFNKQRLHKGKCGRVRREKENLENQEHLIWHLKYRKRKLENWRLWPPFLWWLHLATLTLTQSHRDSSLGNQPLIPNFMSKL